MSDGRPYMSIGEVLAVLKAEFPDVSVSKIRFLESEGLIAPERTASGYRKFYPRDLDRLRFILKLQRDSFLPLKVIRERLAAADAGSATPEQISTPAVSPPVVPQTEEPVARAVEGAGDEGIEEPASGVRLNENDLATAAEMELQQVRALAEFGVICSHQNGTGGSYFDGDDLAVARIAKNFLRLGIEPRHLKTLRRYAESEAQMYEQLVSPSMRNRRPDARQQAVMTLTELAKLSRALRHTYLRQSLRGTLTGDH
jgi:DNA-binding transcriptional MerR regulator